MASQDRKESHKKKQQNIRDIHLNADKKPLYVINLSNYAYLKSRLSAHIIFFTISFIMFAIVKF